MKEYEANITFSTRTLTVIERISLKNSLSGAIALDEIVQPNEPLDICVNGLHKVEVHNERSKMENTDYTIYAIEGNGQIYTTSSENAYKSLTEQLEELQLEDINLPIVFRFQKLPSANFKDKFFLNAVLVGLPE